MAHVPLPWRPPPPPAPQDEADLIREEVAAVVGMTPEQRADALLAVCESATLLLSAHPAERRAAILSHRDELPPDSAALLERLRRAGAGRG